MMSENDEDRRKEAAGKPWMNANRGHQGGIGYKTDRTSTSQNGVSPVWDSVCGFQLTMEDEDFLIATHNELLARLATSEAERERLTKIEAAAKLMSERKESP